MTPRNTKTTILSLCLLACALLLTACGGNERAFRVGVSQCSDDEWRVKMNNEMRREADCIGSISLTFRSANDDSYQQSADIDSFIEEGVDLLVVAPNEARGVTAAIRRARSKGIRVILADRNTDTKDYDAYVGASNYEVGWRAAGNAIVRLHGHGTVLEITGLRGSTPADERHRGFIDGLREAPGITVIDSVDAHWIAQQAEDYMLRYIESGREMPDFIFCHNDRMGLAVHKAYEKAAAHIAGLRKPLIVGVDGLSGQDRGIDLVDKRVLEATFIYPSGGYRIMQVADSLLRDLKPQKNTTLSVALVDTSNVHIISAQRKMTAEEEAKISRLNDRLNSAWERYATQNTIIIAGIVIIALIGIVVALIIRAYRLKVKNTRLLHQKIVELEEQKRLVEEQARTLEEQKELLLTQRKQLALFTEKYADADAQNQDFLSSVRDAIKEHMSEPNFGVVELADAVCLSRAQLFRKVKEACNCSPVELIRAARLKRAAELFKTTDKGIAEVCYATGFSSPSYFTRCYKSYFDEAPRAFKRQAKENRDSEDEEEEE